MLDTIGMLVVALILFMLCLTQDETLDAERDFWIKARKLMDQPPSQEHSPYL